MANPPLSFLTACCQFRYHFKCIAHNSIIGCFEERCFRIFIDHHDHFTSVYSGQVLNGAGNADGNI